MSEYIRTIKFDTNECPNISVKEKLTQTNVRIYIRDQYSRIFEYIRHPLDWTGWILLRSGANKEEEEEGDIIC